MDCVRFRGPLLKLLSLLQINKKYSNKQECVTQRHRKPFDSSLRLSAALLQIYCSANGPAGDKKTKGRLWRRAITCLARCSLARELMKRLNSGHGFSFLLGHNQHITRRVFRAERYTSLEVMHGAAAYTMWHVAYS